MIVFLPFRSGRPRVGGDQGHAVGLAAGLIISTHAPAWGRPVNPLDVNCAEYFYSRPHVGGDAYPLETYGISTISTHAPAWGATIQKRFHVIIILFISTPAPVWGATPFYLKPRPAEADFYSRPRVGGDQGIESDSADKRAISTHAPAWGATVMPKNSSMEIPRFLLTPQNRGRTHRCSTPQAETGV